MLDDYSLTVLEFVFLSIGTKPMYRWRPCIFVFICCYESKERQHLEVYTNTVLQMCVYAHIRVHIMQFFILLNYFFIISKHTLCVGNTVWVLLSTSYFFWLLYLVWYQNIQTLCESNTVLFNLEHNFVVDMEN